MKNLYISNDDTNLADLNICFDLLYKAFCVAKEALDEVKKCKSERINQGRTPAAQKEYALFFQREHALFVAEARAKIALNAMHPLLQPVWEACKKARSVCFSKCMMIYEGRHILRANVITAETLYNEGCALYFDNRFYHGMTIRDDHFNAEVEDQRQWVVMKTGLDCWDNFHGTTSQTGSALPPPPYMTKREANSDAWNWCKASACDGGRAILYNVRNGRKLDCTDPKTFTPNWGESLPEK